MKSLSHTRMLSIRCLFLFGKIVFCTAIASQSINRGNSEAKAVLPEVPESAEDSKVTLVDCYRGEKIAKALAKAEPGDTIQIVGTCNERILIKTDRITLDGLGTATIDGGGGSNVEFDGVVNIEGARGVIIQGLTIRNGPGEGILGWRGAAFIVRNTLVESTVGSCVAVTDGSTAELSNTRLLKSNDVGLRVYTGSSAIFRDVMEIAENGIGGVDVNGTSILELRGARVNVSKNGFGITAGSNSQLAIFDYGESATTLTLDANAGGGIALGDSVLNNFAVAHPATVTISGSPVGIIVRPGTVVSPFGTGTFILENNNVGLDFRLGGGAIFRGGLIVRKNRTGIRTTDGAGVLWFISIPPNPSTITGNDLDVDLRFGARATFDGVAVGTITCEPSVLVRGLTCP